MAPWNDYRAPRQAAKARAQEKAGCPHFWLMDDADKAHDSTDGVRYWWATCKRCGEKKEMLVNIPEFERPTLSLEPRRDDYLYTGSITAGFE